MKTWVRYFALSSAVVLLLGSMSAGRVAADKPIRETHTVSTADYFGAYLDPQGLFNACTGERLPEILVDIESSQHYGHPNNYVSVHGVRTVNVDDETGFTLNGTDRIIFNKQVLSWVINDTWQSPEGDRFVLHMQLIDRGDTLEHDVERLTGHCLGGETILPTG